MSQEQASTSTWATGLASTLKSGFMRELETFKTLPPRDLQPVPQVGSEAPRSAKIALSDGWPTLIVFLRHCGCPFAEKTFRQMATLASQLAGRVRFIAVSHSSAETTERWVMDVGGTWGADVIIDEDRDLYAQWGLGMASAWETISPTTLFSVVRLGINEGVWNRPAENGSRWQKAGAFAVDANGIVRWLHVPTTASDVPDLVAGIRALGFHEPLAAQTPHAHPTREQDGHAHG
ncbi:hypothetical protein B0I35DRAFT_479968 [Stachybotrys elegans]|uniref:Thioredoxin domain-containing protein n=1 Tax=Stachybotrys elegans TaxID=80388 RepID=A0A8K0SRA1_9HYPO|nr:hypothetical protein B0I35DRAFT_479968 [Stachybotrys elegans]